MFIVKFDIIDDDDSAASPSAAVALILANIAADFAHGDVSGTIRNDDGEPIGHWSSEEPGGWAAAVTSLTGEPFNNPPTGKKERK